MQIMQSQGAVMLGQDKGTLFVPAKIAHTTSARDLRLPIQLFLPLVELQSLPLYRKVTFILNGDSFKPNKLIIRHVAEQVRHPTHDGLCFRFLLANNRGTYGSGFMAFIICSDNKQ